jgi:glucokinase-like ROK family protein
VQLELNPGAGFIVSAEIGVGFISVACASFTAEVVWRAREETTPEEGQPAIIERALSLFRAAVAAGEAKVGRLLGLAVGLPGLVDERDGALLFAPNLGWRDVPIRALLQGAFPGAPIYVDNEANMAALGEVTFGAARGYQEVLYLSAGVGLGGAAVRQGKLVRGVSGVAGEFGHMTLYPDGEWCNCGNQGCWETEVSQAGVLRSVRRAIDAGQSTRLAADFVLKGAPSLQSVIEAARAGDIVARLALSRAARELGIGIASLVNVLNPDLVLFGGIMSVAADFLLPVINDEVRKRALRWNAEAAVIAPARHGSEACVMGGVAVVYQTILAQPGGVLARA